MKKLFALLLAALMLVSMTACGADTDTPETTTLPEVTGYIVPQPMTERPDYSVSENPTVEELRETAVRAMHDMLSIQWSTEKVIDYNKTGAVSHKDYHYEPETIYCGLPYADGQTNIYVWLEYYDYRSGQLKFDGDGQWLNANLGNTCAGSLMWAWSTVCDSLTGKFVNTSMVPKYGCIPVGTYTYASSSFINSYYDYSTEQICAENGLEVMFESYAQIKKADAITNSKSEHTMMATTDAVVVYNEDGTINGNESYIMVQDQAAGTGDKFYEYTDPADGNTYHYTGRTGPIELKCTFLWMFQSTYIPVTTAEFLGQEPYANAEVKISKECAGMDDLMGATITSNYPMCMMKVIATNEKGQETVVHYVYFDRYDVEGSEGGMMDGKARNYKVSGDRMQINTGLEELAAGKYTITAEVTVSTGEVFDVATFEYSK